MKKLCFQNNSDGFYGTYYPNPKGAKHAMIGLFGDDPNDFCLLYTDAADE